MVLALIFVITPAHSTLIIYMYSKQYIVVAADGYTTNAFGQPRAMVGDTMIYKLFPFGEGGILAVFGETLIETAPGRSIPVQSLITAFMSPDNHKRWVSDNCRQLVKGAPSEAWGFRETTPAGNFDNLARSMRVCSDNQGTVGEGIDLVLFYFDPEQRNRPTARRCSVEWSEPQPNCRDVSTEPIRAGYDDANGLLQKFGTYGTTTFVHRMIFGVDKNLRGSALQDTIGKLESQKKKASMAGQAAEVEQLTERLTWLRNFKDYVKPTPENVDDPLKDLQVDYEKRPVSESCARLIASRLVKTELELTELPAVAPIMEYERVVPPASIRWSRSSETRGTNQHRWHMLVARPGEEALWVDDQDPDACHAAVARWIVKANDATTADEWAGASWYNLASDKHTEARAEADLSAAFQTVFDEERLYVYLTVRDDLDEPRRNRDRVQLLFARDMRIEVPLAELFEGTWAPADGVSIARAESARGGYTLHFSIPRKGLDVNVDENSLDFDVRVRDSDGENDLTQIGWWSASDGGALGRLHLEAP